MSRVLKIDDTRVACLVAGQHLSDGFDILCFSQQQKQWAIDGTYFFTTGVPARVLFVVPIFMVVQSEIVIPRDDSGMGRARCIP